jgi:hypothetical protein
LLDAAERLAGPFLVFNEAEAHVAIAVVAEAYAGAYSYFGFGQQALGELQRAEVAVLLGDLGPARCGKS